MELILGLSFILFNKKASDNFTAGILPTGASYLLLEEESFRPIFGRVKDPWVSSAFRSLSPVHFASVDDLQKKLTLYVSNKKNKNSEPRDRSKANTAYTVQGIRELTQSGEMRSEFEWQRSVCLFSVPPEYLLTKRS